MSTLGALWSQAEAQAPHKTALVDGGKRLTYRQTGESIRRILAGLTLRWQIPSGAIVAVLTHNCAEFVISYFAVASAGAAVQPIDERLTAEEIRATLIDSGSRYVIVHRKLQAKFEKICSAVPEFKGILGIDFTPDGGERFEDWVDRPAEVPPLRHVASEDLAELMYTSGTTGEAKGVMRSHGNVLAASRNSIRGFGYRSSDIITIVMPLSHSSALNSQMIPVLESGGTVLLVNGFDVRPLLAIIRDEGATCIRAVPTMLRMLLAAPDFTSEALPSLRLLINSSAPIDPQTYRAVKQRFPAIQVMNSYGLTEASTCTVLPDHLALSHVESVGHPIDGVEMCVRDEEGRPLDDFAQGEIFVRGAHVFVGYHNRPEATRNALSSDGWLRTGDVGYRDGGGLYYLSGRKNDLINCGGRKFAPIEVETCILAMPEVSEVAVVGVPHKVLGQVARAFVVPAERNGLRDKQIVQHCARNLPSYKVPFSVMFVAELPKTSTGKFLHRKLREI
jgi:acyl-CoA synthetase (AMP-forming)/AMP-acid ligase II